MSEDELRRLHDIYTDCWKLHKKYADATGTDEYWEGFVKESSELYRKHGEHRLAEKLLCALSVYIEEEASRKK